MFNRPPILGLLCCYFLLSACASTPTNFWYTSTEQLIENHSYQKAIEQITADVPLDQALLLKVKKLANKQRKKQVYKIGLLIKQKKWGEARYTLKQLHFNQPSLTPFSTLNLQIDKAQQEEERVINTQLALLEAELLGIQFIQQDLADRIYHYKINWFSQGDSLVRKKQQLAENLLQLSTQALVVKDYKNAQKTYEKAIEFDRDLSTREIKNAINTGLSHQNNKAINKRRRSLIKQLDRAISILNFESLLKIEEILSHEPFHGVEVERALHRAKNVRIEHSHKLNGIASTQYRKGNISFAVIQWQQALRLTPTDIKIQERLIRAQKVQRKLNKLTSPEESPL